MRESQIPKIIHYCWFGGKEKPENVRKCLQSWKNHLEGYRFIEWNEHNFSVNTILYSKEAYAAGKYAFVSDVARIQGLLQYGGIYMDTDVEVRKDFSPVLNHSCILGFEEGNYVATSFMGVIPQHPLIEKFCSLYQDLNFQNEDGTINTETNVQKLTQLLADKGLKRNGELQELEQGITVFPQEYFSPYDYINCYDKTTEQTYCIHHFYVSWMSGSVRWKKRIKKAAANILGPERMNTIRGYFK